MSIAERTSIAKDAQTEQELPVALPPADLSLEQDEEWCVVCTDGEWQKIRMHDYDRLFSVPGLYEHLIYDILKCDSPATIRGLLEEELSSTGTDPAILRTFDFGAGNGMVGEQIAELGAKCIVGVDIIEAAKEATDRDRPGIYEDYHILDLTDLSEDEVRMLKAYKFNSMTCVAALGFGDIPTRAFAAAYNVIQNGGWIAFNIKEDFLDENDQSGFSRMVRTMIKRNILDLRREKRYRHRLGTDRQPIHYVALVGIKRADIGEDLIE